MRRRTFVKSTLVGSAGIILAAPIACKRFSIVGIDEMKTGFLSPPGEAHPQVWWAWLNGHITKEAITNDLEGMKRVGIRGFQLLEFSERTAVNGPVIYGSPEHFEMLEHTAKESERLGLEFSIHNCPGWSATGGPWIPPELSMQVVTWSETMVEGGKKVQVELAQPASQLDYYKDAFVIAFPTPANGTMQISGWRRKANFPDLSWSCHECGSPTPPEPFVTGDGIIAPETVIDITQYMNSDGALEWESPDGNWTILRIGHTTTKAIVFPAPEGGKGLECDKFSKHALEVHFENYYNTRFLTALKPLIDKGLASVEIDSHEAGVQNWTPAFPEEFKMNCGYDIISYMPSMTGRVVGSEEISERFLWDVRKTQAKLMNENYYVHFNKLAHNLGLKTYAEAYYYTVANFDNTSALESFDVPMGEFWVRATSMQFNKVVSSVGHLNAKPIIAAEAWTMDFQWRDYPGSLKVVGDINYALGMNHFYLNHMTVSPEPYQLPGLKLKYGGILNVNNTWFEQGKSWIDYMSRCEYMLQQGHFVADILYFGGENSPVKVDVARLDPKPPYGYDFDIAATDIILNKLKIENGDIVVPDCMSYKVLFIPDEHTMSLELLKKLHALVQNGMKLIVGGSKPERTPGLSDYPDDNVEFERLVKDIWNNETGEANENVLGEGIVYSGMSIEQVLKKIGVQPDFEYTSDSDKSVVNKIHRKVGDADIYYIASRRNYRDELVCTFRVKGKRPEFWNALNGEITPCYIYDIVDDKIILPIQLDPFGSIFVVFRNTDVGTAFSDVSKDGQKLMGTELFTGPQYSEETIYISQNNLSDKESVLDQTFLIPKLEEPAAIDILGNDGKIIAWQNGSYMFRNKSGDSLTKDITSIVDPVNIEGPWNVSFDSKSSTPGDITLDRLISLTEHSDPDVKYFSGTATYKKKFEVESILLDEDKQLFLDLGKVMVLAEVIINGKNLGVIWTGPFRVNITDAVQPGENDIEVKVTNTWVNRLVGDDLIANKDKEDVKTDSAPINRNYNLQDAGLFGPVQLRTAKHLTL